MKTFPSKEIEVTDCYSCPFFTPSNYRWCRHPDGKQEIFLKSPIGKTPDACPLKAGHSLLIKFEGVTNP